VTRTPKASGGATTERKVDAGRTRFLRRPKARDERGASLILALIFIIVISAMTTALTSWVTADLKNTSKFTSAQSIESAANSATEAALQSVRYDFESATINAKPPVPCWTTPLPAGQITITEQNFSQSFSVFCSTLYQPSSTKTRTVTISTCTYSASASAAATCAANPLLQAVVIFNAYPSVGASQCTPIVPPNNPPADQTTCGAGMTIVSWAFNVVPPTVTSVFDAASVACSPSELVTVTGTGFSGATSVNFVPPVSGDTILSGTNVSTNSAGTIVTACASTEMVSGTVYQVSVTTPAGTSGTSKSLTY
jgi:Tfp pilus assembly protein PilX